LKYVKGWNITDMKINSLLCKLICFIVVSTCFIATSCTNFKNNDENDKNNVAENTQASDCIVLTAPGVELDYTLDELIKLEDSQFEGLYSTINNWPTAKTYAARGITIEGLLKSAGLYDKAQIITIVSRDGYKQSFTRNQMLDAKQYYYVDNKEVDIVKSILAYEYKEDSTNLEEVNENKLCFVIGQTNYNEHTNPVFIEDVVEIKVSFDKPEKWDNVFTFPAEGGIDMGEKIKLQHKDYGLVKIYYTLDGTDPTTLSSMYNPSTYQPELNAPIEITENTVIKAFAVGYGKEDSDIVTFKFEINQ